MAEKFQSKLEMESMNFAFDSTSFTTTVQTNIFRVVANTFIDIAGLFPTSKIKSRCVSALVQTVPHINVVSTLNIFRFFSHGTVTWRVDKDNAFYISPKCFVTISLLPITLLQVHFKKVNHQKPYLSKQTRCTDKLSN